MSNSMSGPSSDSPNGYPMPTELAELLESLCLGELTRSEAGRLEELIAGNAECCRHYIRFMHIQGLGERYGREESSPTDLPLEQEAASALPISTRPASPILGFLGDIIHGNFHLPGTLHLPGGPTTFWALIALLSCASTLVLVCVLAFSGGGGRRVTGGALRVAEAPTSSHEPPATNHPYVARLARTANCHWASDAPAPAVGESLASIRKLSLKSGLAEIAFNTGASIIVEGPATLELTTDNSARLSAGKLTALVPTQAIGFIVQTPVSQITDLGTEFGVAVDGTGQTDLHVFQGKVQVAGLTAVTAAPPLPLGEGRGEGSSSPLNNASRPNPSASSPATRHAPPVTLNANESAHVAEPQSGAPAVVVRQSAAQLHFVRNMDLIPHWATIDNASFEEPRLYRDEPWRNRIPGWIAGGENGGVNQFGPEFAEPVPDGRQLAFLNTGEMAQELKEVLAAKSQYELTFWVGHRPSYYGTPALHPDYTVELWAGESKLVSKVNPVVPLRGHFAQASVTVTTAESHAALGKPLRIVFRSNGSVATGVQNHFDNVQLWVQPVGSQRIGQ
jgi:hypothetical protein